MGTVVTSKMNITRACTVFLSVSPVNTINVRTNLVTFDYEMEWAKLSVQSENTSEVYTVTQFPYRHTCNCLGYLNHSDEWTKEARQNGTAVKTCKHIREAVASGLFSVAPIGKPVFFTEEQYWITTDPLELHKANGKFYVPLAVTGGALIEVKMVTQKAALFA